MAEKGRRITFWVGTEDSWVVDMLDKREVASEVAGFPSSRAKELMKVLKEVLREDFFTDNGCYPD